jgi:hypothetical protein
MQSLKTARLMTAALMLGGLALSGLCGCKEVDEVVDKEYKPQTTEDNVLHNFQVAYREKEISEYAKLLASDFQFYFDPATRNDLGIEFWTRTTDSLQTEQLFKSPDVTDITIELSWPLRSAQPAGFLSPRDGWTKLSLTDVFLDVDIQPTGGELTTYRVENQTQRFFFRRGRTHPPSGPSDTLMYIVEWRDEGALNSISQLKAD